MLRPALALLLLAALPVSAPLAHAETGKTGGCLPSTTLKEFVMALDDAVSGPANKDRACLRALMLPGGQLSPMVKGAHGSFAPKTMNIDGWAEAVSKRGSKPFYERQVKVTPEVYGHIAHLWTTYEIRPTPTGKAEIRGINSIQAVFDGKRWRLAEILWEAETPGEPLPAKDRPGK